MTFSNTIKELLGYRMIRASRRRPLADTELESLHIEPTLEHFNDSSYFFGSDGKGTAIATRIAFRTNKTDEAWVELRLPGQEGLRLGGEAGPRGKGFELGALDFECLEVGRRWSIRYRGEVSSVDGERLHEADLNLEFTARTPIVDFARTTSSRAVADAMARREWSRDFFEQMKEVRKNHYEQGGRLRGRIIVDGNSYEVDLASIRDHSFGRRSWRRWQRHLWVLGALDDGSYFNVSMVKFDFIDALKAGWRWHGGEPRGIVDCDNFGHFGPANKPPGVFSLSFRTRRGPFETAFITSDDAFDFDLDSGSYRIREWIAKIEINNIPGVGVAEFGWNPSNL